MLFWAIVIVIAIASVGLSLLHLRQLKDKKEIAEVKKELSNKRILYQDSSKLREE